MTKTAENHTLWGRTYLYSPYTGVPPTPPGYDFHLDVIYDLHQRFIHIEDEYV